MISRTQEVLQVGPRPGDTGLTKTIKNKIKNLFDDKNIWTLDNNRSLGHQFLVPGFLTL